MTKNPHESAHLVVTRHKALFSYLLEKGIVAENTPVLTHVTSDEVKDHDVIGVLPLHLAALTKTVTEIPLNIPKELRGKELTLTQVRQYAGNPVTYNIQIEG